MPPESPTEPAETCVCVVELCEGALGATLAATCVPLGPESTFAPALTAGVEALVETVVCAGVTLTLVAVDVEAGGVVVPLETETAGGAVWALAVADAEAAGVLTLTFTLAAGAGLDETLAVADTATLGVAGVPGRPSACAGSAKDRHHKVPMPKTIKNRRKPRFRAITVFTRLSRESLSRTALPELAHSKPISTNPPGARGRSSFRQLAKACRGGREPGRQCAILAARGEVAEWLKAAPC
jgi:hypothetical protein